jgi:hypothetical protein
MGGWGRMPQAIWVLPTGFALWCRSAPPQPHSVFERPRFTKDHLDVSAPIAEEC